MNFKVPGCRGLNTLSPAASPESDRSRHRLAPRSNIQMEKPCRADSAAIAVHPIVGKTALAQ